MNAKTLIAAIFGCCMASAISTSAFACDPLPPDYVKKLVLEVANREGLDPDLAGAVAEVESAVGLNTESPKGASGIMQLMPDTAADMGVSDRCNPVQNVVAGIRYLKQQIQTFNDPILALAAYNAGPDRVLRSNGVPMNRETVEYVIKILNIWKFKKQVAGLKGASPNDLTIASKNQTKRVEISNDTNGGWVDGHVLNVQQGVDVPQK